MLFGTMIQWRNPYFIITLYWELQNSPVRQKNYELQKKFFFLPSIPWNLGSLKYKKIVLIFFKIFRAKKSHFFPFLSK